MNFGKSGVANWNEDSQKFAQTKQKSSAWDCDSSLYDSFELQSFISLLNQAVAEVSSSTPDRYPKAAAGCVRSFSTPRTAGPRFVTDSMRCNIHNTVMAEKAESCSGLNKQGILSRSVKKLLMRIFHKKTLQHGGGGIETGELCKCYQAEVQSNSVLRKCRSERISSQAFDGLRRKK